VALDSFGALAGRLFGRYGDPIGVPNIDEADQHDDRWEGGRFAQRRRASVIDDRDDGLTKVLTSIHEKRRHEPITVAVVYGAAHMRTVVEHLRAELGYLVRDAEWLTVRNAPY
jgi:hypothetical protein